MANIQQSLYDLLEDPVREIGYELYDIEIKNIDSRQTVQIFFDAPEGVGLEDCVNVNRLAQEILDEHDPIAEAYVLEVSSPGLFRKLKTQKHFQSQIGKRVKLRYREEAKGIRNITGILKDYSDEQLLVQQEDNDLELTIPFADITKANLEPKLDF